MRLLLYSVISTMAACKNVNNKRYNILSIEVTVSKYNTTRLILNQHKTVHSLNISPMKCSDYK